MYDEIHFLLKENWDNKNDPAKNTETAAVMIHSFS